MSHTTAFVIRLKPGADLKKGIQDFVNEKQITGGWISTGIGSLTHYNIRFANQPGGSGRSGHFEILLISGTVSVNGSHLHILISDENGNSTGGHLLEGCTVYSTAEIVIFSSTGLIFKRETDETTGWKELTIK